MKKYIHKSLYSVMHQKYSGGGSFMYDQTIVKADSKEEAMNKLNDWLKTNPNGVYTSLPCENIDFVFPIHYLK